MIKAIILDFDGVIAESVDIKTDAFGELFSQYTENVKPIVDYHLKNNAVSRFIKFKYMWENILKKKYSDKVKNQLANEFSKITVEKVIDSGFVNGALNFLESFYKKVPIFVASAVPQNDLDIIVQKKGLKKYFKRIYGNPTATKEQAIVEVAQKESIQASEILFVGDSIKDMEAALSQKAFFVGRLNKDEFQPFGVPYFADMKKIKEYLISKKVLV